MGATVGARLIGLAYACRLRVDLAWLTQYLTDSAPSTLTEAARHRFGR